MNPMPTLQQVDRTYVVYRGKRYSYFSGCDYFRLSSHPALIQALHTGAEKFGLNVAASRLTTGNHALYEKLETRLARFFKVKRARLVSSGYVANLVVAQALAGDCSHALVDERAHVSLHDAAAFLGCSIIHYKHRDPAALARHWRALGRRSKPILLTDGLFGTDGSVAPLDEYLKLLPSRAIVIVDDAHGAGVLGDHGRGTAEYECVSDGRIVQTATLSKAFGVYGGVVLASERLSDCIVRRSNIYIGNTPLPLPIAAAALRAVEILESDRTLRQRLREKVRFVQTGLRQSSIPLPDAETPIVSLVPRDRSETSKIRRHLLSRKIYPPFINYPGGPPQGCFRFAISSEHSREQLENLLGVLLDISSRAHPPHSAAELG